MKNVLRCSLAALVFLSGGAIAQDAAALLKRAARAMGADEVRTLRYTGSGTGGQFGQAYRPDKAWPKINYSSYERQIDYQAPAMLAKSGKKAKVIGVADKHVLSDGSRTVEVHKIRDPLHTDTFLMVWLPKERLLIEADAYTPLAPNAAPPSPPNPYHVNLVDNVQRLKLDVDRILPLHGRIVPMGELYRTVGRSL